MLADDIAGTLFDDRRPMTTTSTDETTCGTTPGHSQIGTSMDARDRRCQVPQDSPMTEERDGPTLIVPEMVNTVRSLTPITITFTSSSLVDHYRVSLVQYFILKFFLSHRSRSRSRLRLPLQSITTLYVSLV